MIIADTSSLISIAAVDLTDTVLQEYDVHTTGKVVEELEETSEYDDRHGKSARGILDKLDRINVHKTKEKFSSSRIDIGEGSCAALAVEKDADFLLTDDLRALPELQTVADAKVAISPILLRALVKRKVLEREEALEKLEELAEKRDWLGAPIYRRAEKLFD